MKDMTYTRATRSADRDLSRSPRSGAEQRRAAHTATRTTQRLGQSDRRPQTQMTADTGTTMAYQQGFTSGPLS